jgi:Dolichyl-phosphate-mannose-protein mannosyltransferase
MLVFLFFQMSYFNRFLPIQDGWFIEYAKQISDGKIIYKDFHVFVQPIYVFIFSWVADLFGNTFIVFRYYGLVERALLIGVTYLIFSQITNAYRAVFLVLLGMFLFVTNTADVIYSYYQLVAVFVFASAYCFILYYRNGSITAIVFAGIFSGLAFLTKQSTGILVPVALLLTIGTLKYSKIDQPHGALIQILLYMGGFIIPIVITIGYIWHLGLWVDYWEQVFGGASSKGKLSNVLFGFMGHLLKFQGLLKTLLFFALFYGLHRFSLRRAISTTKSSYLLEREKNWSFLGLALLVIAALTPWFINYPQGFSKLNSVYTSVSYLDLGFFELENILAYVCFYFNAALVAYYFYRAVTRVLNQEDLPIAIISVASFAFMYAHGLSGFIEPHAIIISAGLLFGWLLSTKIPFNLLKNAAVYLLIIFIISMCAFGKASWMYSWWGWDERIAWTASKQPNSSLLKGFRLNEDKVEIIDGITKSIQQNSNEGDPIYIFPHMPMFYLLANRPHKTFSAVHYFDVCSDALAISDAKIVASTKPKVILYMDLPESVWSFNEKTYRGGARSGQREIKELIERLKANGEYKAVQSYITSGYGYKIEVLVKSGDLH